MDLSPLDKIIAAIKEENIALGKRFAKALREEDSSDGVVDSWQHGVRIDTYIPYADLGRIARKLAEGR